MIKIILMLALISAILYAGYKVIRQFQPYKEILIVLGLLTVSASILTIITILF